MCESNPVAHAASKVTGDDIDTAYDVLETINLCNHALFHGDADQKTQGSIAWLLGSAAKRMLRVLTLLEEAQSAQNGGQDV